MALISSTVEVNGTHPATDTSVQNLNREEIGWYSFGKFFPVQRNKDIECQDSTLD